MLPEAQLQGVGAGVITTADKRGLRCGNLFHGVECRGVAFDPGRIAGRTDDHEIVVHDGAAVLPESRGHEIGLSLGTVGEDDVGFALFAKREGCARTHRDWFEGVTSGFLEAGRQGIEESRVGGTGGGGEDDVLRATAGHRRRGALSRKGDRGGAENGGHEQERQDRNE